MTKKKIDHDDLVGEEIDAEEQDELRKGILHNMLGNSGTRFGRFPGSQPVSLSRRNLKLLKEMR